MRATDIFRKNLGCGKKAKEQKKWYFIRPPLEQVGQGKVRGGWYGEVWNLVWLERV